MRRPGESGYLVDYGVSLHLVESMADVAKFKEWLEGPHDGMVCFDTETSGLLVEFSTIRLAQIGDRKTGWAIPWERWGGMVVEALEKYDGEWGLWNAKFDMRQYVRQEPNFQWPWDRTHDGMGMAHLIDPLRSKGLKPSAGRLVDPQAVAMQSGLELAMSKQGWDWDTIPVNFPLYWQYGALDPVLTSHMLGQLLPQILDNEQWRFLYDLEMGVTRVVAKMERRGVLTDPYYCEETRTKLVNYMNEAEAWVKETYGLPKLTSVQLMKYFTDEKIQFMEKRTKGGSLSMDKEVLETVNHPVARTVLSIRKAKKLVEYLDNFLKLKDPDNRLHANFWTMGTRTARMSITDPALQTLPKKDTTIRGGVIPSEGYALVSFDMDQVEARLMAIFSQSKAMIDAFNDADQNGGDFFCKIASQVYGEDITDKKDFRRQLSKITVYGLIYGGGAETLAANVGVTVEVMTNFLGDFFRLYPEVRTMQQGLMNLAQKRKREEGMAYVCTPNGRRLVVDDDKDYTATNYLIQSHAAEIMKQKVVQLDSILDDDCHILLLVHDEILLEIPEDRLTEVMADVQAVLNKQDYEYPVRLTWGGDYSLKSWGDLVD